MAIDDKQLEHLAHLAHLELNPASIPALRRDFSKMLKLADQLANAADGDKDAVVHIQAGNQPLREDKPVAANQNLAELAAEHNADLVILPKVIE